MSPAQLKAGIQSLHTAYAFCSVPSTQTQLVDIRAAFKASENGDIQHRISLKSLN